MKNIKYSLFLLFIFSNKIFSGIEALLKELFKENVGLGTFRESYLYSAREIIKKNNDPNMPENIDELNKVSYFYKRQNENYKDLNTAMMNVSFIFLLISAKRFFKISTNIYKSLLKPDEVFKKDFKKIINYKNLKFYTHRFKQRNPFLTNLYGSCKNIFKETYFNIYNLYSDKNFSKYYKNILIEKELEDNYLIENKDIKLLEYKENYLERINNIIKNNFDKYKVMMLNNFNIQKSLGISEKGIYDSLRFMKLAFEVTDDEIRGLIYGKNFQNQDDLLLEKKEGLNNNKNELILLEQKNKRENKLIQGAFKLHSKISDNRIKNFFNTPFYSDKEEYIKVKIENYPLYNKEYIISAIIFFTAIKIFLYFYNNLQEVELEEKFLELNKDDSNNVLIGINDIKSGNYSKLVDKILKQETYEKARSYINTGVEILLSGSVMSYFYSMILTPNLTRFNFSETTFTKKYFYNKIFKNESKFKDFLMASFQNSIIRKKMILFPLIVISAGLKPLLIKQILTVLSQKTKNNIDTIEKEALELIEKNKDSLDIIKNEASELIEKNKDLIDKDGKIVFDEVINQYFIKPVKILNDEKNDEKNE